MDLKLDLSDQPAHDSSNPRASGRSVCLAHRRSGFQQVSPAGRLDRSVDRFGRTPQTNPPANQNLDGD